MYAVLRVSVPPWWIVCTAVAPLLRVAVLGEKLGEKLGETRHLILTLISQNSTTSIIKLAQELGMSTTTVEKQIALLKKQGHLRRIGPAKGGYWEVV